MNTCTQYITIDDMVFATYNEAKEHENDLLLAKANMLFEQGVNLFDAFNEYPDFICNGPCGELKAIYKDSILYLAQNKVEIRYTPVKLLYSGNILLRQENSNTCLIISAPELV